MLLIQMERERERERQGGRNVTQRNKRWFLASSERFDCRDIRDGYTETLAMCYPNAT